MNAVTDTPKSGLDVLKWLTVVVILGAIIGLNKYFEFSALERAIALIVALPLAGFIAAQTSKGQEFLVFAKESKLEVRKVVWPTRKETNQTTMIIGVVTLIMGLLLWLLDAGLLKIVSFLTGLGV